MKIAIRIILLTCLMAVALTMTVFTLTGFRTRTAPTPTGELVLGQYGENVAVFDSGDFHTPLEVTDIPLSSLRASDRTLVEDGLRIGSREELAAVLEDLGS